MSFWFEHRFPYTDLHEMNLDWFLNQFKTLVSDWDSFYRKMKAEWEEVKGDWNELYKYVHDYFDNLDVSDEISAKIDELVENGTISAIVNKMVNGKFYDVANIDIAGQIVLPDRTNVQTFCADDEYVYVFCTLDGTETNMLKYSITTGALLNNFTGISGKIASCGVMGDYLICAHDLTDILVLNKTGSIVKTLSIDGVSIYAVTSDNDFIYCVDGNNPATLYKLDFDGTVIMHYPLSVKRNMTMQSIKCINNNLYMSLFDTDSRLYIISVYTVDGTFITNISVPVKTELEDICRIGEDTYVMTNNFGSGTLFKITLEAFPLSINYTSTHNQIKTLTNVENDHYYFNSNSDNLWFDGKTSAKPLNRLLNVYNLFHDYLSRLDIELLSDYEDGIVLRYCSQWFQIIGNNHSIGGLYIENNENLIAKNVTFTGHTYAGTDNVYVSGGRAEFTSCTFTCVDETNMLNTPGCDVSLTSCVFNGNTPSGQNIRSINGTYNIYNALTIDNFTDIIIRDGMSIYFELSDTSWLSVNAPLNNVVTLGTTIHLRQLKSYGCYRVLSNSVDADFSLPGFDGAGFIQTFSKAGMLSHVITLSNHMYNVIIGSDFAYKKEITTTSL